MNLEAVTAELRPRGPWEAADFGARMIRRDAAVIYRVWFMVTLPLLGLAVLCILFSPFPDWVQMGYWWLEPLADGPILYVISRRLFGENTDARAALRAMPGITRQNWIFLLTPYRLHFARSLAMPLTQLEGLSGKRRRERAKVLNQSTLNYGIGVTVAYQHLALSLFFGIILLGFAFVPTAYWDTIGLSWFENFYEPEGASAKLLGLFVFYAAQSALHPWFVGAGFGLYINCRTILEAWDIEVAFRRMLQRREGKVAAAAAAVLLAVGLASDPAMADGPAIEPWWDAEVIEAAEEKVFEDEALRTMETVERWVTIDDDEVEEDTGNMDLSGFEVAVRAIGRFISVLVEFGLWVLLAVAIAVIIATSSRWLPYVRYEPARRRRRQRIILASGEITAETLPDDIPAAVLSLWAKGERRQALSLLYRGSVFAAVDQHGVRLPNSATEGVCVDAVAEQTPSAQAEFFRKVVAAWVWCAYGSKAPADETVAALCDEWPSHYGATA